MITERPILMMAVSVRGILEDLKGQTRRLRGLKQLNEGYYRERINKVECRDGVWCFWEERHGASAYPVFTVRCPYGARGDELWVRERFRVDRPFTGDLDHDFTTVRIHYYADEHPKYRDQDKWKPSIHMPRKASRIQLRVTDVRVERVQGITAEGCIAEGVQSRGIEGPTIASALMYLHDFEALWDSINAKRGFGWDVNPWVFVVSFERIGP